jgi:outer membrane protein OmpA-like peptidoglycan-associated protein
MHKITSAIWGSALVMGTAAAGCAHDAPPRELLDARAAYQRAEYGQASRLSPTSVHEADLALQKAERSYQDDAKSPETRDMAYVAERKAQLAEVQASTMALEQQKDQNLAAQRARSAEAARAAEGQLKQTQAQLDQERQARKEAETRARQALDKLAMANTMAVKDEPRGTVVTLPGNVLFASGKAELRPGAQGRLDQIATALKDDADHQITVEGHTDSRGSDTTTQALSQARAQAVRDYLVSRGLDQEHVKAVGLGASRPIADNASAEGRATNRRVEIVIEGTEAH